MTLQPLLNKLAVSQNSWEMREMRQGKIGILAQFKDHSARRWDPLPLSDEEDGNSLEVAVEAPTPVEGLLRIEVRLAASPEFFLSS